MIMLFLFMLADEITFEKHTIEVSATSTIHKTERSIYIDSAASSRFRRIYLDSDYPHPTITVNITHPNGEKRSNKVTLFKMRESSSSNQFGYEGFKVGIIPGLVDGCQLQYLTEKHWTDPPLIFSIPLQTETAKQRMVVKLECKGKIKYYPADESQAAEKKVLQFEYTDLAPVESQPWSPPMDDLAPPLILIRSSKRPLAPESMFNLLKADVMQYRSAVGLEEIRLARRLAKGHSTEKAIIGEFYTYVSRSVRTEFAAHARRVNSDRVLVLNYAHPTQKTSLLLSLLEAHDVPTELAFFKPSSLGKANHRHLEVNQMLPLLLITLNTNTLYLAPYFGYDSPTVLHPEMLGADYCRMINGQIAWDRLPLRNVENSLSERVEIDGRSGVASVTVRLKGSVRSGWLLSTRALPRVLLDKVISEQVAPAFRGCLLTAVSHSDDGQVVQISYNVAGHPVNSGAWFFESLTSFAPFMDLPPKLNEAALIRLKDRINYSAEVSFRNAGVLSFNVNELAFRNDVGSCQLALPDQTRVRVDYQRDPYDNKDGSTEKINKLRSAWVEAVSAVLVIGDPVR